jgi:uncharacterized protein (DUF1501 family)
VRRVGKANESRESASDGVPTIVSRSKMVGTAQACAFAHPQLKPASPYKGRDLAPTTDLRAVTKGVLHEHLGVAEGVLAETVFPDSAGVTAARGLVG